MSDPLERTALLLAAHGERRPGAENESVFRIARALIERGLVADVAVGFVNSDPTVKDALDVLTANRVVVYPLFASNGYFTRDRLVQLLDDANQHSREVQVLPPLGLDPALPDFVSAFAQQAARDHGFKPQACNIILLAHGSRRNPASREATEQVARDIRRCARYRQVRIAFLEERPFLDEAAAAIAGPAVVIGLFSGEGLHGARDAPRLTAELGRDDVIFAGVIGNAPGLDDLVARSVGEALLAGDPASKSRGN